MAKAFLQQGQRYRATVTLGFFEKAASDDMIKGKLEDAGFSNVTITRISSSERIAEGVWPGASQSVDLPSQIKDPPVAC